MENFHVPMYIYTFYVLYETFWSFINIITRHDYTDYTSKIGSASVLFN